ncbi:unnamed protein product [Nezara viridula]|uniref:Uncharacterized protein n=1 Tax=Nezara viridula TaxID=85310 RepID=A0A9P0HKK2_NEZVI|nr:unnamed protein product [Nezara viridula]
MYPLILNIRFLIAHLKMEGLNTYLTPFERHSLKICFIPMYRLSKRTMYSKALMKKSINNF